MLVIYLPYLILSASLPSTPAILPLFPHLPRQHCPSPLLPARFCSVLILILPSTPPLLSQLPQLSPSHTSLLPIPHPSTPTYLPCERASSSPAWERWGALAVDYVLYLIEPTRMGIRWTFRLVRDRTVCLIMFIAEVQER